MSLFLTDHEKVDAVRMTAPLGMFPVLNETERRQRWHRKIHVPSVLSRLAQQLKYQALSCYSCGGRRRGVSSNGRPRSWWVDIHTRRVVCWGCSRNVVGKVARFNPPRGFGFAECDGYTWLHRTTSHPDYFVALYDTIGDRSIFAVWHRGRYLVHDRPYGDVVVFDSVGAARAFVTAYAPNPTPEQLRSILRADTRCMSQFQGRRCRHAPDHPERHRWWSPTGEELFWY